MIGRFHLQASRASKSLTLSESSENLLKTFTRSFHRSTKTLTILTNLQLTSASVYEVDRVGIGRPLTVKEECLVTCKPLEGLALALQAAQ